METKVVAAAQHNDAIGTVAVDWSDQFHTDKMMEDAGIPDGFLFMALSLYGGNGGDPHINILAVKESEVGTRKRDEIARSAADHTIDDPFPVYRFWTKLQPGDLLKYTDLFEVLVKPRLFEHVVFGVAREIDLKDETVDAED